MKLGRIVASFVTHNHRGTERIGARGALYPSEPRRKRRFRVQRTAAD
jgi:hypothetical protein